MTKKKEKYIYQEKPILKSLTTKNNLLLSVLPGDQHRVRVLGTEFNIQAYGDENIISTTLVTRLRKSRGEE